MFMKNHALEGRAWGLSQGREEAAKIRSPAILEGFRKMRSEEPGDSGSGRRSPLEARRPAGPHSSLQEMRATYRSTNRPGRGGSGEGG